MLKNLCDCIQGCWGIHLIMFSVLLHPFRTYMDVSWVVLATEKKDYTKLDLIISWLEEEFDSLNKASSKLITRIILLCVSNTLFLWQSRLNNKDLLFKHRASQWCTYIWVKYLRGSNILRWMFPISIPSMLLTNIKMILS